MAPVIGNKEHGCEGNRQAAQPEQEVIDKGFPGPGIRCDLGGCQGGIDLIRRDSTFFEEVDDLAAG